jgi:hypothetical protein
MDAAIPVEAITPSVNDVAELLRARTKNSSGFELGTFTDDTRPTSAQVIGLARAAAVDIQARLGPNPPAGIEDAARGVATVLAAMMAELSFFPEQVQSNRSPYDQLAALFTTRLQALTDWAGSLAPGEQRFRSLRIPVLGEEYIDEDGVARPLPLEPVPIELANLLQSA